MARMGFIQDEMDLKLLVLYIMARIAAPITFLQLLELALCDAGVDYFSLTQAVEHLVETEHLSREGERYAITEKGRRNSEICESSLPYSVRRRCDDNLVRVNETLMREQQVQGEVLPNPDGTCTVRLRLADDSGPLLELSLLMPAAGQGERAAARFKQAPEQLYHQLVQLLAGRPILLFPVQAQLFQQPLVFQKGCCQLFLFAAQFRLQRLVFRSGNGHHFLTFFGEFSHVFHT